MNSNTDQVIKVNIHFLMQQLGLALRYALTRNNHLQPYVTVNDIKDWIVKIKDKGLRNYWANKLLDELNSNEHLIEVMEPRNINLIIDFRKFLKGLIK